MTFTQRTEILKKILRGWLLVLGLNEGLVEYATVGVKSEVILTIIDEQDEEEGAQETEESNNNDLIGMNSPSRRASRPATHQPTVRFFFSFFLKNHHIVAHEIVLLIFLHL